MTTPDTSIVAVEEGAFDGMALTNDQSFQLKQLTEEVLFLEALRGKNALDLGNKLKQVRGLLGNTPAKGGSAWGKWCDTFMYTRDYAARLIQIADVFDTVAGADTLSIRHMREIARISSESTVSVQRLTDIVNEHNLGVHDVRHLVTDANAGKVDIEAMIQANPDLKAEIDRRVKDAKTTSNQKVEQMQTKLREVDAEKDQLAEELTAQQEALRTAKQTSKVDVAAMQLGDGDPEKGKLKIKLEQATQERDNLALSLDQTQKALQKVQGNHDKWVNSPAGQAKLDFRRLLDEMDKFFKDTLTPAYVQLRATKVEDDARGELASRVELVREWVAAVDAALNNVAGTPAQT